MADLWKDRPDPGDHLFRLYNETDMRMPDWGAWILADEPPAVSSIGMRAVAEGLMQDGPYKMMASSGKLRLCNGDCWAKDIEEAMQYALARACGKPAFVDEPYPHLRYGDWLKRQQDQKAPMTAELDDA